MSSSPARFWEMPDDVVHIGDRESDIYELFCAASEAGTHFPIRAYVDRLAGGGDHTIAGEMDEVAVKRASSLMSVRQKAHDKTFATKPIDWNSVELTTRPARRVSQRRGL